MQNILPRSGRVIGRCHTAAQRARMPLAARERTARLRILPRLGHWVVCACASWQLCANDHVWWYHIGLHGADKLSLDCDRCRAVHREHAHWDWCRHRPPTAVDKPYLS